MSISFLFFYIYYFFKFLGSILNWLSYRYNKDCRRLLRYNCNETL